MPVIVTEKHLKASASRKTYNDKRQLSFVLRTTPNGAFSFYYLHLNKKNRKRDWHLVGVHPELTPERARDEATHLAGLVLQEKSIKQIRSRKVAQLRAKQATYAACRGRLF